MPSAAEVSRALYGAWLLARLDPRGMTFFDLSVEGFWRSFFAAVLAAPGYAILVGRALAPLPEETSLPWAVLVGALGYVGGWAAFVAVLLALTTALGLSRGFVPCVVAANWATVLQVAASVVAVLLAALLPRPLGGLVQFAVEVAVLVYQWFVIRTALQTNGATALGIVVALLLLSFVVTMTSLRLV